ncbi:protein slit-like isoform X2 [Mytilus californianus]|uniref:protein slit-like isoform X2 n=1 Tax=Mytilus californianus TaxID=6549 RepID=UPI00224758CC|nr:protein slit-like isoform X2 [Mytilus californianus]
MRQTIFLIICTVFKSTVLGCPEACSCDGSTVFCGLKGLTTVPSEIPNSTTVLDLQENQITSIDENIFNGFTRLQTLKLNTNRITSLDENIFNGLTELQTLDLQHNQITSLDENIFNGLTALQILSLQNNQITSLDENIFSGLTGLEGLELQNNQITSLDENIFNGLTALETLELQTNQITSLDENIFNGLTALQILDLHGNPLNCSNCELEHLKFFLQNHNLEDTGAMCNGTMVVDYGFINCIEMTTEGASVTTQHQTSLNVISTDSTTHLRLIIIAAVCGFTLSVISILLISCIYCHYKSKRRVNSENVD